VDERRNFETERVKKRNRKMKFPSTFMKEGD
jgi:hypothetical protein